MTFFQQCLTDDTRLQSAIRSNAANLVALVIGPSGAGKSDYGSHAEKVIPRCRFFDLDKLVRERSNTPVSQLLPQIKNDAFLGLCQREVDVLLQSWNGGIAIIAVGAGALESVNAGSWLSQHPGPTIVVIAPPDEVYSRGGDRNKNRNLAQFTVTEYSQHRRSLYKAAKYECDVAGLSVEDSRIRFVEIIRSLL